MRCVVSATFVESLYLTKQTSVRILRSLRRKFAESPHNAINLRKTSTIVAVKETNSAASATV